MCEGRHKTRCSETPTQTLTHTHPRRRRFRTKKRARSPAKRGRTFRYETACPFVVATRRDITGPLLSQITELSVSQRVTLPALARPIAAVWRGLACCGTYVHTHTHRTQNHASVGKERGGGAGGFCSFSIFLHFPTNGRVLQ